ncbi:MAG: hypothetical protein K2K13_04910 [Clostridiales bacterium]|nr:hypothetical protein [Clostridiales bacterium]
MKKRLLVLITALVMVCACVLGLVACGGGLDEGTYVMYGLQESDGQKVAVAAGEMELKDGKITYGKQSGTYKVSGDTLTVTFDGKSQDFTKDGNMWKATDNGNTFALVKKGSTPDGYTVVNDKTNM